MNYSTIRWQSRDRRYLKSWLSANSCTNLISLFSFDEYWSPEKIARSCHAFINRVSLDCLLISYQLYFDLLVNVCTQMPWCFQHNWRIFICFGEMIEGDNDFFQRGIELLTTLKQQFSQNMYLNHNKEIEKYLPQGEKEWAARPGLEPRTPCRNGEWSPDRTIRAADISSAQILTTF